MDPNGDRIRQLMNMPYDRIPDSQRDFMRPTIYSPMLQDLQFRPEENPARMMNMPLANPGGVFIGPVTEETEWQHRNRMT